MSDDALHFGGMLRRAMHQHPAIFPAGWPLQCVLQVKMILAADHDGLSKDVAVPN